MVGPHGGSPWWVPLVGPPGGSPWWPLVLTGDAKQQGQVGVPALGPLGQDVADGAEVPQAGGHLSVELLGEAGPGRLQGGPVRTPPLGVLQALLQEIGRAHV